MKQIEKQRKSLLRFVGKSDKIPGIETRNSNIRFQIFTAVFSFLLD